MDQTQVPGGNANQDGVKVEEKTENSEGKVSRESYIKAVDEAKRAKAKLAELEAEKKKLDEAKLLEQGEYKKLLTDREKELDQTKKLINQFREREIEGTKLRSFEEKLGGRLKSKQFLSLVDLKRISYDPQTETVDPKTVDSVVGDFMKEFGYLVETTGKSLPNDPAAAAQNLSYEQWLSIKDPEEKRQKMKFVKN